MKRVLARMPRFLVAALLSALMLTPAIGQKAPISFDAPGAGTGAGSGTFPTCINRTGWIGGRFLDASGFSHGFLRAPDGTFTVIDAPGASYTGVTAINSRGDVVGNSIDVVGDSISQSFHYYAFLRTSDGKFHNIQDPSNPNAALIGAMDINDSGQVAGWIQPHLNHGPRAFLWTVQIGMSTFDAPGETGGTSAWAINAGGVIVGTFDTLAKPYTHAFVRDTGGNIMEFDAGQGAATSTSDINATGQITGWFVDNNEQYIGYLRQQDGTITLIPAIQVPVSINDRGVIVGNACCSGGEAFERHADGSTSFIYLPFANLSNSVVAVNNNGHVIGFYADLADVNHGWVK
jgi:uncharacterized membrane protein